MKLTIEHLSCTKCVILYPLVILFCLGYSLGLQANGLGNETGFKELSCHEKVIVSLDRNCQAIISPETMISDLAGAGTDLIVKVSDLNGVDIGDTVEQKYRGVELLVRVFDTLTGNSCWGSVLIEDKYPPIINCRDTIITCFQPTPLFPDVEDNCNGQVKIELIDQQYFDFLCENDTVIGIIRRKVQAVDGWANSIVCEQEIILSRETILGIECPADSFIIECCSQLPDPETGILVDALWSEIYAKIDSNGYPHPIPVIDQNGNSIGLVDPPYRVEGSDTIYFWQMPNRRCNVHVEYHDHIFSNCGYSYRIKREWLIKDLCTAELDTCIQYITIQDTIPPVATLDPLITDTATHTECKAYVEIFSPTITEECGLKFEKNDPEKALKSIKVTYDIVNKHIPFHGAQTIVHGELDANGSAHIYLPIGEYTATWILRDACFNSSAYVQDIIILDYSAPVPICKGTIGVTLNPDSCYARLWAYEFDNGSFDNCCEDLHFAVANKDTIDFYQSYWTDLLSKCYGYHPTEEDKLKIQQTIDHWINCYIFDDYIDVWDCGTEKLAVRIYEACGLPIQDPHIFTGSKHNWFCFNLYDDYACHYKINYDKIQEYGMSLPRPILGCEFDDLVFDTELECGTRPQVNLGNGYKIDVEHNPVCCDFQIDPEHSLYEKWEEISNLYPAFDTICRRRYSFPHKYNDCWFEVEKIDKVAPECQVSEDVTVYCDGLHYNDTMIIDLDTIYWSDISYANSNPHYNPETYPWDGLPHGYYNGPMNAEYHYSPYSEEVCVQQFLHYDFSKPIYCRFWLLLDQFDRPEEEFDFAKYFSPVFFTDNCSIAKIDTVQEDHINECGNGYISRKYIAYDGCDNSTSCYQQVIVKARSDFEVIFPKDTVIVCDSLTDLSPTLNALGYPMVSDDDCELVGINVDDQIIHSSENEVCRKIVRNWTVIDWCVYNENNHLYESDIIVDDRIIAGEERPCVIRNLKDNGDGVIHYQQVIYLIDNTPPLIVCHDSIEIIFDGEDCKAVPVNFTIGSANDACTPDENIAFTYYVDLFQNNDAATYIFGVGNKIDMEIPEGVHALNLIARDECGNVDTCRSVLTIKDLKPPTPYCHVGIASVIMQSPNQQLTIWASDLNAGSFDNCDPDGAFLEYAFDEEFLEPNRVFDCDDLGVNDIFIWVRDRSGNKAYCRTYLEIQEGTGNCSNDSTNSVINNPQNKQEIDIITLSKKSSTEEVAIIGKGTNPTSLSFDNNHIRISQNSPNPFSNYSLIKLNADTNYQIIVQILDIGGVEKFNKEIKLSKGINYFRIEGNLFNSSGIKYVKFISDSEVVTKKILYVH